MLWIINNYAYDIINNHHLRGGGGGVHPDFFVKLDFEIAVVQQTRARDRTFEGVPDSGWRGGGGWPPFLSRPYPVFPNGTNIMQDKKGQKY